VHTKVVRVGAIDYRIHHNGDWSGEVIVTWQDGRESATRNLEVKLPGELFKAVGKDIALKAIHDKVDELGKVIDDS
jgi:hypothetical protein